jgi:hypothetical protein
MQCPENGDRRDRGTSELGRYICGDAGEAKDIDVQHFACVPGRFQIRERVISQTEIQPLPSRGLLDHIGMTIELVANGGPNEIGPVRVKPVTHHQIDVAEIDIAKIDRDFLGIGQLGPEFAHTI